MNLADTNIQPVGDLSGALERLSERFHNNLSTAQAVREQHGHTMTWHENLPPDAVVFAQSVDDVAEVVKICAAHRVPVIAFGTGTSLEGHVNAPLGGVSIDTSQMNRILAIHPEDLDCVVEPGVTREQLNSDLRDTGLFFPIDPGANASIGGMTATRASGTNAVRYGTMKDNVMAVTAVLADGSIIKTGTRAKKSSAGYDLTRLMVGSEGTLGIITDITLKLYGIPEAISGGVCPFDTLEGACNAVISTIQCGIPVARIELLDEVQVGAINEYAKMSMRVTPTLFLEFHGSEAGVAEQSELFGEIAAEYGGGPFEWTSNTEERTRLWKARHEAYYSVMHLRPGAEGVASDVCVPISRLAECILATKEDIEANGFIAPIVGHVGDGNFHVSVMVDKESEQEQKAVDGFLRRLVERAIAMDGTCTGEHGVGTGKMKYLDAELGGAVDVMRTIKQALDPLNILNPGKIIRV